MRQKTRVLAGLMVGFLAVLAYGVSPAEAAKGVKKKGEHKVHGTVVSVEHKQNEIVVKTHHHHKKAAGAKSHTREFRVSSSTRFTVVHGKKHTTAKFSDVHQGDHVSIVANGKVAEHVAIHHHKHKKKKK